MSVQPRIFVAFLAITVAVTIGGIHLILAHFRAEVSSQYAKNQPAVLFAPAATQPAGQPQQPGPGGMGQLLLDSLRSVEGCLGADAGEMASGKNVIIGWFQDAEAARRWYAHPTHRALMGNAGARPNEDDKPLAHVEEGVPLMVIAAITFSQRPEIQGVPMPISQISIEVFQAAPGGAYINGKLAPEAFKVEHMKNFSAPKPE
ncbi:MAG: hypothetical protein ACNA8P_05340 [Phycisphaerales bacterium]